MPDNDKLLILDEATKNVLIDDDVGFLERMFGYQTRVRAEYFQQLLVEKNYIFL